MMKSSMCSCLIFFSLLVVAPTVNAGCKPKPICDDSQGFCLLKSNGHFCNGTLYNKGCKDGSCACCITNTSICIPKPKCIGGECVQGNWSTCKDVVDSSGCHGDGCACCMKGDCEATPNCTDNDGYCFLQDSNHKCNGTFFGTGCKSSNCACCIPDKSLCFPKPRCIDNGGHCLAPADHADCNGRLTSGCYGDGCKCCITGK